MTEALAFGTPPRTEIGTLKGHEKGVRYATFSLDGKHLVTASDDNTGRLWDAASGREISVLRGHEKSVRYAVFNLDGSGVVTASDNNTARIWDAQSGRAIAVLRGHEKSLRNAVFNPDGTCVITHLSLGVEEAAAMLSV